MDVMTCICRQLTFHNHVQIGLQRKYFQTFPNQVRKRYSNSWPRETTTDNTTTAKLKNFERSLETRKHVSQIEIQRQSLKNPIIGYSRSGGIAAHLNKIDFHGMKFQFYAPYCETFEFEALNLNCKKKCLVPERRYSNNSFKEDIPAASKRERKEPIFTIPNALTLSRILMTPVLGYMVLQNSYAWACAMFIYAGVTDMLDGWIARKYPSQVSALGSFLDPLADKFLVCTLFATLTIVDLIPAPLTALVICRDIVLIGCGFYVRYISLPPDSKRLSLTTFFDITNPSAKLQPTLISKINTAIQLSLVSLTLAAPVFGYVDHSALHALWYITASTTVISGIGYIFIKDTFQLRKKP